MANFFESLNFNEEIRVAANFKAANDTGTEECCIPLFMTEYILGISGINMSGE